MDRSEREYYKPLKNSVIDQKRNGNLVPRDLYTLVPLLARWNPSDNLPVCLLCRDLSKQPSQLGHIFPKSVLKEAGHDKFFDSIRGTEAGISRMGYRLFCCDCENIFKQGEDFFNPRFFKKLVNNPEWKIEVKAKETLKGKNFPWLYYTLISIVWRSLCVIRECGDFIELLECLREYLLNREASRETLDTKVKLFLFAPNSAIIEKLNKAPPAYRSYFYNMFNASFNRKAFRTNQTERINVCLGKVLCGPLYVTMIYSEENFAPPTWKGSMLTTETELFTIGDQYSRFFPEDHYDVIVHWGSQLLSSTTRLPSADKDSTSSSNEVQGTELFLLPKDVSYHKKKDEFGINHEIYKEISKMDIRPPHSKRFTFFKAKRGKEKILFVAVKGALKNGGDVAVGLEFKDDGTVSYMKGVYAPQNVSEDLSTPPFKQEIEMLIKDLGLQIE